jgi:hypothetical protein
MLAICVLNVLFALNMNYSFSLVIWGGFAIAGLFLYFPAHTKLTRLVATRSSRAPSSALLSPSAASPTLSSTSSPWACLPTSPTSTSAWPD